MYPIFHTLSNVQTGDAVQLQQPIDNCNGDLYVGLKSIIMWLDGIIYNLKQIHWSYGKQILKAAFICQVNTLSMINLACTARQY